MKKIALALLLAGCSATHGFVRLDPRDPHGLAFEDGKPFRMLGENRINVYDPSWNWSGLSTKDYVAFMAQNGMNTLRVFLFADSRAKLGCLEPRVGKFDERAARDVDAIFEAAEKNDVYVVLTVFALGFTPGDAWKGWEGNPYNMALGGCAKTPRDFFDSPEARAAAKEKLRYVLDRWGSSPHLLAIDLLNEPEWDGAIGERTWMPWAEELAAWVRAHDAHHHLVTVGSVGLHWNVDGDERPWYASARNDLVEWHLYGKETYEVHDLSREMARKVRETWRYGKPVFCGEFAWGGEEKPLYDHTHVGIWTAAFSGAGVLAHSAPPFTEDSDELMTPERAAHFRALARFLEPLEGPLEPRLGEGAPSGLQVLELVGQRERALWLLAPREAYGERVSGARVEVELEPGEHEVAWIDDTTGATIARSTVQGGRVALTVPPFVRHVAARIRSLALREPGDR